MVHVFILTERHARIWDAVYSQVFTMMQLSNNDPASTAHAGAVATADNAIGRLVAGGLPRERLTDEFLARFR